MRAFKAACKRAKTAILESQNNKEQLFLHNLGTRPAYRGRGGASTLIKWGLSVAKKEGKSISLLSNSAAKAFYEKFGFKALESVEVFVECEDERLFITPMVRSEVQRVLLLDVALCCVV